MSSDATHVSVDAADEPEVPARATRLRLALFLAAVGWYLPFAAVSTVLLPARLAQLDPAGKTLHLGVITGVAAVIALVASIGFGMASDRTRSRFGRRSPWIVGGALARRSRCSPRRWPGRCRRWPCRGGCSAPR